MAEVVFQNVSKRFGSVSVIEDLDLEIRDHEFMVLVGPSGCGKSTALRMIAGLEEVSAGEILIGGRVVTRLAPKDRDIAMVFQNYALYPHMSVRENLAFGLKIRKLPKKDIDSLVNESAQILGIEKLLDRKPKELSGGQRQRVAVGRAIVRQPAVFLFDEPLSNLDAKLRVQMRAELTRLQQRLETTCVYVTHDQVEAMTMGHRIAVMNAGRIQQVGTPLEVYERPATLFVANFIGTPPMNFLRASVDDGTLRGDGFLIPAPPSLRPLLGKYPELVLGVRPENVTGDPARVRGTTAKIRGSVELVEPLGHQVIVHSRVGDAMVVATFDQHHLPRVGEELDLHLDTDRIHMFDPKTERRVQ